jgi:hypothetical protein
VGDEINVTHWINPEATGSADGSSPENTLAWTDLAGIVASLPPGSSVGILAEGGRQYRGIAHTFTDGGMPDDGVIQICGVGLDRRPMRALITSTRPKPAPDYHPEWARQSVGGGVNLFNFKGADNLAFRYLDIRDVNFGFQWLESMSGLIVDDVRMQNVRAGLFGENAIDPDGRKRRLENALIRKFVVEGFQENAARFKGDCNNIRMEGFYLNSMRMQGHITIGIQIGEGGGSGDQAHDITLIGAMHGLSGIIEACHDTHYEKPWFSGRYDDSGNPIGSSYAPLPGLVRNPALWDGDNPGLKHWQGDGITAERDCYRIFLQKILCRGCTDGGYDIKALDVFVDECGAEDNKKNWRVWSRATEEHPHGFVMRKGWSKAARKRGGNSGTAHIFITGNQAGDGNPDVKLTVEDSVFSGSPDAAYSAAAPKNRRIKMTEAGCTYNDGIDGSRFPYLT